MKNLRDVVVGREREGEEELARSIVAEAFGDDGTPRLLDRLRESSAWKGLSFLARVEGRAVAHVCYTRGWVNAPERLVEVLILSPMSVLPAWQRRGIGTTLIQQSLGELVTTRTEPVVFLEGNPAFYSKCGFVPALDHGFTRPSERIPPWAFQCSFLPSYKPSIEGALVYPDTFWELDSVGLRP